MRQSLGLSRALLLSGPIVISIPAFVRPDSEADLPTSADGPNTPGLLPIPAWLALIVLFSFLLRGWYTIGQSVTFDEYYEIQMAQESIPDILAQGDGSKLILCKNQ